MWGFATAGASSMRRLAGIGLLSAGVWATGCHTPFSRGFRENHRLAPHEVRRIQFYTSGRILLRRSENTQTREQTPVGFDIRAQVDVEEIDIESGTPCVAVQVRGEYIAVSFSQDDVEHVLWFTTVDSPFPGRYALTHLNDFPRNPEEPPDYSKGYTIRYGTLDYQLVEPQSWKVYLLFDEDVSLDREIERSSPNGWRLDVAAGRETVTQSRKPPRNPGRPPTPETSPSDQ